MLENPDKLSGDEAVQKLAREPVQFSMGLGRVEKLRNWTLPAASAKLSLEEDVGECRTVVLWSGSKALPDSRLSGTR